MKKILIAIFITLTLYLVPQERSALPQNNFENLLNTKGSLAFNLSTLIQAYLAAGDNVEALTSMVQINVPENSVSAMLAKKWVRNASVRIFNDPLRSFLEIVINGCDATLPPHHAIGKFGMGFFSIFSFLSHEETGGALITLQTAYTTHNTTLFAYEINFVKNVASDILVEIKKIDQKLLNNRPGTMISIMPAQHGKVFSAKTIDRLLYFIHYLDFHPHANVVLKSSNPTRPVAAEYKKETLKQSVFVTLEPSLLQVYDSGTGIPLTTAFTQLLIPSNSSKTVADKTKHNDAPQVARFVDFNIKGDEPFPHFLVTVNGVVVIDKQMKQVPKNVGSILISLPQTTNLTVARDELMVTGEDSCDALYIKKIITKTIEDKLIYSKNNVANNASTLLEALYQGLLAWEKQTAAHQIKGLFTGHFKTELDRVINEHDDIIPVPLEFFSYVQAIIEDKQKISTITFIPLSSELARYNFGRLEEYLRNMFLYDKNVLNNRKSLIEKSAMKKLLAGVSVFFVKDKCLPSLNNGMAMISPLGLRTSLFVPESIVTKTLSQGAKNPAQQIATKITARVPHCEYALWEGENTAKKTVITSIPAKTCKPSKVSGFAYPECVIPGKFIRKLSNNFQFFQAKDLPVLEAFFNKHYKFLADSLSLNLFWSYKNINPKKTILSKVELFDTLFEKNKGNDWKQHLVSMINNDCSMICDRSKDRFYVRTFFTLSSQCPLSGVADEFKRLAMKKNGQSISSIEKETTIDRLLTALEKTNEVYTLSLCDFMNTLFGSLLMHYGVYEYNISTAHPMSRLFIGKEQVLPFEACITTDKLEKLFFTIIYHSYLERPSVSGLSYYWKDSEARLSTIQRYANMHTSPLYLDMAGFPHKSIPDFIEQSLDFDLEWADTITKTLHFAIDDISVGKSIGELLSWSTLAQLDTHMSAISQPSQSLSIDQKLQLMKLKESLLGLYHSYLSIPDSAFKRTYGGKEHVVAIHPSQDATPAAVMELLSLVAPKQVLFKKLLGLQLDDFCFQTASKLRAHDLEHNKLYMPTTLSNSPFSILAALHGKGLSAQAIHLIIEKVTSAEELLFVGYLLLQQDTVSSINKFFRDNKNTGDHLLTVIIEQFIRERLDKERLHDIYEKNRCQKSKEDRIKLVTDECAAKLVCEYIKSALQQKFFVHTTPTFISKDIKNKIDQAASFTLTKLLQAHSSPLKTSLSNALKAGDIDQTIAVIQQQTGTLDLSKIQQSIEAGSEKMPLEGTIIESLQNSVDAIKWHILRLSSDRNFLCDTRVKSLKQQASWWEYFKLKTSSFFDVEDHAKRLGEGEQVMSMALSIVYKLEIMQLPTNQKEHIKLTIRDHVGMDSLETLLTDFIIPDYSRKSLEHGNIGDMGNGIFKMYQNASHVVVLTRSLKKPEHAYCLHITPIRTEEYGSIKDLSLRISDVSSLVPKDFFGTSIKILYQAQNHNTIMADLLSAKELLFNSVGCTQPLLFTGASDKKIYLTVNLEEADGAIITLNNDHLTPKTLIYEYKEDNKTLFTIYQRAQPFLQSYLTTSGIPMRQLTSVAREMKLLPASFLPYLSNGYILDLALGTYEPVQSRTRLNMNEPTIRKLRKALLETFYIIGLHKGASDQQFLSNHISHFASTVSDFDQLRLSATNYNRFSQQFNQFIAHGISSELFTIRSFFDFYKARSAPYKNRSFYDHLEAAYQNNACFKLLGEAKKKATTQAEAALKAWLNANKQQQAITTIQQCINLHDRNTHVQNLHSDYHAQKGKLNSAWEMQRDAIFNTWKKQLSNNVLIATVVMPWAAKKVHAMTIELHDIDEVLPKIKVLKSREKSAGEEKAEAAWKKLTDTDATIIKNNLKKALTLMLDSYCKVFFQKLYQVTGSQKISAHFYYAKHDERSGYFSPSTKEIYINLHYFNCADQAMLFSNLTYTDITSIQACRGYTDLYAPKVGRTPTLIHELEHARRNNSHTGLDAHSDGINSAGELTSFESCANSFANLVLQRGLLHAWSKNMHEKTTQNNYCYKLAKALYENNQILYDVEAADKEWLLRKLGFC